MAKMMEQGSEDAETCLAGLPANWLAGRQVQHDGIEACVILNLFQDLTLWSREAS